MAKRDQIIQRIKAMRAKAQDAAATESEAMAAAEMAARLLAQNDIKPEELANAEKSEAIEDKFKHGSVLHPVAENIAVAVGKFTETLPYSSGAEIRYVGLEQDVLMALYLTEMLVGASKRAWVGYAEENCQYLKHKSFLNRRLSYFVGFASRVSDRLIELHDANMTLRANASGAAHGSALVVVKRDLIERKIQEMGLRLGDRQPERHSIDPKAYDAGAAEGDKANFNRSFSGAQSNGAIK